MDCTLTTLKETNTKKKRNELLEHFYCKKRCFNDLSIRLSSKHIPIHPKMQLEKQNDYDQHIEVLNFLFTQLKNGFKLSYMATIHLGNPNDYPSLTQEQWARWKRRRTKPELVKKDVRKIIEAIMHLYYGIKAPKRFYDQILKLVFFEVGEQEEDRQFHVHILLPRRRHKDNFEELKSIIEGGALRERVQCISTTRRPHVKPIDQWKLERKRAFRKQFNSAAEFIEFSLEAAWDFTTNTHSRKSKNMISLNEYCKRLDEKNSTASKLEVACKKKEREKKIKK